MTAFRRFATALLMTVGVAVSATAHAETVYVKYRGPVLLDGFRCNSPVSSLVHRICYRSEKQYLVVLLQQTYYHYCRIPQNVVEQWLAAESKGRFYIGNVKGNYDCRLGGIPTD